MTQPDTYHEGEIAVQERTGARLVAARNGAVISTSIMASARPFLARQRVLAVGAADARGQMWASLWFGKPGFVRGDDGQVVTVTTGLSQTSPDDPVRPLLQPGSQMGMLAIELESRRRLRINGIVGVASDDRIEVTVTEAYPNCPKYIQQRNLITDRNAAVATEPVAFGKVLGASQEALVRQVDTLFVASRHVARGADVSHRGGNPGFVHLEDGRKLRIPDYRGNNMFQTLGNFEVDPRAGVVLVHFEQGRLLSVTGPVTVWYGTEDPHHPTGGTGRYWELTVEQWIEFSMPDSFRWLLHERSPFNPAPYGENR